MTNYELLEKFPFRHISDPSRVINLNNVTRGLLEMFCLCRDVAESVAVLTWPSRIEDIAILHALAELQQIAQDTPGRCSPQLSPFCTYMWPWKQNSEAIQKNILVDRLEFTGANLHHLNFCANSNSNSEHFNYANLTFHMALNRLKDLDPGRPIRHTHGGGHHAILSKHPSLTHPTLFEITPQSAFHTGFVKNLPLANNCFLKRSKKYIQSCDSLSASELYKIESAPFFMLGIPSSSKNSDFHQGDLFTARRPNIVLLDLSSAYSRIGNNWEKQLNGFLSVIADAFSDKDDGMPPVLAITDEPLIFNKLLKLLPDYEEKRRHKRNVSSYSFLNVSQSLFDNKITINTESPVPSVMVASYANDMSDIFIAGQKLQNKAKELGSEQLSEQLNKLNHTIRNILNMPGGMNDYMLFVEEYCDQSQRDIQTIALKPREELVKTKMLIEAGDAGAERIAAEDYLDDCSSIIDGLKNTTPLKSKLDILYKNLLHQPESTHALVFPNKLMKDFAIWMINNHREDTSPRNINIDTQLAFFDNREALDHFIDHPNTFKNVYLILPRQRFISRLLAQDIMPRNLTFVCDGGTVISLLRFVDTLERVPGLELIRSRLAAIRQPLQRAADSRVSILGDLDEIKLISSNLIYNLCDIESGHHQGHPVIIKTEEAANISTYEGSEILRYQEDNDLQPFSKTSVSELQIGDKFFIITPEFVDAASERINITAMATETLKAYHTVVMERVRRTVGLSYKDKAENIQRRMIDSAQGADIGECNNINNIIRWINVEWLLELPREQVKPHAPQNQIVFKHFMKALGVSDAEIGWYWTTAIQSTRKVRIRAGHDRYRVFYKLLLDPTSVGQLFHGDRSDLRKLIDIACESVFTVSRITKEHGDDHP